MMDTLKERSEEVGTRLDSGFGRVEHSGQVETWDAFLLRDVVDRSDGIRLLPRVQVRERTAFEARMKAMVAFSIEAGVVVDAQDVALRKVAA